MPRRHPLEELLEELISESLKKQKKPESFKEIKNVKFYGMIAPDGTVQLSTLTPSPVMTNAMINMLASKGICDSFATMKAKGFKLLPVYITATGEAKAGNGDLQPRDQYLFATWDRCSEEEIDAQITMDFCPVHTPEVLAKLMQKDEMFKTVILQAIELYHEEG